VDIVCSRTEATEFSFSFFYVCSCDCDVTLLVCRPVEVSGRVGGKRCLHLAVCLAYSSALKTEAGHSSQASANFCGTARPYVDEDNARSREISTGKV
jgi:hypothetical protein